MSPPDDPEAPAEDLSAEDLSAEDLSAEDLSAEDLSAEDLSAEDLSAEDLSAEAEEGSAAESAVGGEIVRVETDELAEVVRVELRRQFKLHRGPLPDAELLAAYENVLPGLADRIVRMAELEQGNRHVIDRAEVQQPYRLAKRGQYLAIATVGLVLAFATYLVFAGSPVAGSWVAGIDLVGLVAVFITGQWPARHENPQDDHELEPDD